MRGDLTPHVPLVYATACNVLGSIYILISPHGFSINNLLGFDQFGQISGSMVVDGKIEMINMRAMKLRRWNMSVEDSAFVGFMNNDIMCSIQKLER